MKTSNWWSWALLPLLGVALTALPQQAEAAACTGAISSGACSGTASNCTVSGNLNVANGASCSLNGVTVNGNLQAGAGSTLAITGGTVSGNVQTNGSTSVILSDVTVGGNVQPTGPGNVSVSGGSISGNLQIQQCGTASVSGVQVNGNVQIQSDTGATSLTGSTVGGNIQLQQNAGGTTLSNNSAKGNISVQQDTGGSTINGNTSGGNIQLQQDDGGLGVTGNSWKGNLQCQNDSPAGTGQCACVGVANGGSCGTNQVCDNGNCNACTTGAACTPTNKCDSGTIACSSGAPVCVDTGNAAVTCSAEDQCHVAGVCSPSTGVCSNPNKANGSACNDGNACTDDNVCTAGVCAGTAYSCASPDQCHQVGTCNGDGTCSFANKSNGTACNDGNACTDNDVCTNGTCGGSAYTCASPDECHQAGTCNGDGTCSFANKSNGTSCNDGNACTQTDTCQAGACIGSNPVTCTASDQCHGAGTCNPSTGQCSNPAAPNGTSCNDGNACTQTDTCQSGACTGSNPVSCTASDQCHVAGSCNPSNGQCSNPAAANGTSCNDGNACTQTDTCQAGTCTGSNPVSCTASDQCHVAGTCNPSSGQCSNPAAANGTSCNDGNACTQTDTCQSGACIGSNPVTCTASDQCHSAGTCNPSSGQCSNPAAANGTSCNDGNACTQTDACQSGACIGSNPIVCTPSDQCHVAGSCDPSSGTCSNPATPNGTLVGYWKFDEGLGTTTADSSGNGLDGTLTAGGSALPTWEDPSGVGPGFGDALTFNTDAYNNNSPGLGNYVSVTDSPLFDSLQNSFTIEAWAYPTGTGQNNTIIDRGNYDFLFEADPNGTTGLAFYNPADGWTYSNTSSLPLNTWSHVAMTWSWDGSAGTVTFYVDGTQTYQTTRPDPLTFSPGSDGSLNIGRQAPGSCDCNTFVGSLDEVRLWNVARTQADIQGEMGAQLPPRTGASTSCDDGNPCTAHDICTSGSCAGTSYACAAPDQCHQAGTCNGDGTCSFANVADSTPCNDGDACTQTDACQGGACTGGNPVVCVASGQCHAAGACNPGTGACSSPADPDGTACSGGVCGSGSCVQCLTNANCPSGQVCAGSTCVQCATNADCSAGQVCYGNNCVQCATSADCAAGLVCYGNTCVQCGSNGDCASGTVCSGNTCVQCATTADCASGLVCNGNACVQCGASSDCPSGQVCSGNACVQCAADADCPSGQLCNGNTCVQCLSSANCPSGYTCSSNSCVSSGGGGSSSGSGSSGGGGPTNCPAWANATTGTAASGQNWAPTLASDSTGQYLIAAAYGGDIWTSSNFGASWADMSSSLGAQNWIAVASDSTGANLVAAVVGGDIFTSNNSGASWTNTTTGSAASGQNWWSLASDSTGTYLVAVNYGGDIWTSNNAGGSWTNQSSAGYQSWISVASDSTGANLVAVVFNVGDIWTSTNYGATWTDQTAASSPNLNWRGVASDSTGTHLVAVVQGGDIWTSGNAGLTWNDQTPTGPTHNQNWIAVASDSSGAHLVAVANGGDIWRSSDFGATWTDQTSVGAASGAAWAGVASDASGSHLVAAQQPGDIWTYGSGAATLPTNTATDADNCGACGNACNFPNASARCAGGSCSIASCNSGYGLCGGSCINTATDANNCGSCGNSCPATETCSGGVCGCGGSQTYSITASQLDNLGFACGGSSQAYSCNGPYGFTWNDTLSRPPASVSVSFEQGIICDNGGAETTTLNAQPGPTFNGGNSQYCTCTPPGEPVTTVSLPLSAYNVGGTNTFVVATPNSCEGLQQLIGGSFATVTVTQPPLNGTLQTDPNNCGGCGIACSYANATGQCNGGACAFGACNPGFALCGGDPANGCQVDTATDSNNCGGCGNVCPSGQVCSAGGCYTQVSCTDTQVYSVTQSALFNLSDECSANSFFNFQYFTYDGPYGFTWTDTLSGPVTAASVSFEPGYVYDYYAYYYGAPYGTTSLNGTSGATFDESPYDVGSCNPSGPVVTMQLPLGAYNVGGTNTFDITNPDLYGYAGLQSLNGTGNFATVSVTSQVNTVLQTDPNNCGACGNICSSCSAGSCGCTSPLVLSGNSCINTQTDASNCGFVGNVCPGNQTCTAGACGCNGSPTSLQDDASNCGACGTVCDTGSTCTAGACLCAVADNADCNGGTDEGSMTATGGGTCTSTQTDSNNCGLCGTVCDNGSTCVAGSCTCPSGQTDCSASGACANGACGGGYACTNEQTDVANCGGCGSGFACSYANASATCNAGSCAFGACNFGFSECSSDTCIDTQTDAANCGSCGNVCAAGLVCSAGSCICPPATWADLGPTTSGGWGSFASDQTGQYLVGFGATGNGGDVLTSSDYGKTWKDQSSIAGGPPAGIAWSVASNATGMLLLAAGSYPTNGDVYVGVCATPGNCAWTDQTANGLPPNAWWGALASSADGTFLVAANTEGDVYTGVCVAANCTWTDQSTAASSGTNPYSGAEWTAVASNAAGTFLVAAAYQGDSNTGLYTAVCQAGTSNCVWTPQTTGAGGQQYWSVATNAEGTQLIAGQWIWGFGVYTATCTAGSSNCTWANQAGLGQGFWHVASNASGSQLLAGTTGPCCGASSQSANLYVGACYQGDCNWTSQASQGATNGADWDFVASDASGTHLIANQGGSLWTFDPPSCSSSETACAGTQTYSLTSPDSLLNLTYACNPGGFTNGSGSYGFGWTDTANSVSAVSVSFAQGYNATAGGARGTSLNGVDTGVGFTEGPTNLACSATQGITTLSLPLGSYNAGGPNEFLVTTGAGEEGLQSFGGDFATISVTGSFNTQLSSDAANCGSCGSACAAGQGCVAGACTATGTSCASILAGNPAAPSGLYQLQPAGAASPFSAYCDMTTAGGGWTLVGQELAGSPPSEPGANDCGSGFAQDGVLTFLGVDRGDPTAIATGAGSGIIGDRFGGQYSSVRIEWAGSSYIQFSISGYDIFSNTVNPSAAVTDFSTSDSTLNSLVSSAGGAVFCDSSSFPNVRPGDSSWAVTPSNDDNRGCGCDSGGWTGNGAYYGGTAYPQQTVCCGFGGGWAGTQENGQPKGGIVPTFETQIWIR